MKIYTLTTAQSILDKRSSHKDVKSPKKVVMLLSNPFSPDPRVMKEAKSLSMNKYTITIIAWDREGKFKDVASEEHYKVFHLGPRLPKRFHDLPMIFQAFIKGICLILYSINAFFYALKERGDAYHCHDFDTLHIGLKLKFITAKPLIYDSHEDYPSLMRDRLGERAGSLFRFLEKMMLSYVDGIIADNDARARRFREHRNKVSVVMNCIDLEWFESNLNKIKLDFDKPVILYIGGLIQNRGLEEFLQSKKYVKSNATYLIVGDGFLLDKLKMTAEKLNLKDVVFTGYVHYDLLPSYIRDADLGVILNKPSYNNKHSSPNKLFEYLAGGLPVIVSNLPYLERFIKEQGCGLTVNPDNPKEIAGIIDKLLSNKELMREMSENGKKAVEEGYNWNNQVKNLLELYDRILD